MRRVRLLAGVEGQRPQPGLVGPVRGLAGAVELVLPGAVVGGLGAGEHQLGRAVGLANGMEGQVTCCLCTI